MLFERKVRNFDFHEEEFAGFRLRRITSPGEKYEAALRPKVHVKVTRKVIASFIAKLNNLFLYVNIETYFYIVLVYIEI